MRFLVSIILVTFTFSSIHPIHDKIQSSLDRNVDSLSINLKPMLYSAILPGSGEYSMGYTNRAYLFLGIEALAVGIWYMFNEKGINTQDEYIAFADEHWSINRWFYDYDNWDNTLADSIFINIDDEYYPPIWDESHHLKFMVMGEKFPNGNYFSSNSDEFMTFYLENNLDDEVEVESFFEDNVITIYKDHHYYENIGKYDHFYAGWKDNELLYVKVKESGENIAMSPYKKQYRDTWDKSKAFNDIASYALMSMVANHFASMMDVLILSKLSNNKITNLSAKTYFSPFNPYGIGGIKLSFNWN